MTVYIVASGDYSDYHIDCVFSSRELAQAYIDKATQLQRERKYVHLDTNNAHIVDYEVDREQDATSHEQWWAKLRLEDGQFTNESGPLVAYESPRSKILRSICFTEAYSPKSLEHAKKLCVEDRQAWQREQMAEKGWAPA